MSVLQVFSILAFLSFPIPACDCPESKLERPCQARAALSNYDLVFVGTVTDRRYKKIDAEYFGQNVHQNLISFNISHLVKGDSLRSVQALAPLSAACERFPVATEFLVFAKLKNGVYRIEYCSGAKRTGPDTDAEIELLFDAATTINALRL